MIFATGCRRAVSLTRLCRIDSAMPWMAQRAHHPSAVFQTLLSARRLYASSDQKGGLAGNVDDAVSTPLVSSSSVTAQSSSRSESVAALARGGAVRSSTAEACYASFYASVKARTVGNSSLRKFLLQQEGNNQGVEILEAAVSGCRDAGLRIDAKTSEALLQKLVDAGKLKAALELHNNMTKERVTPTSGAYNILMRLCLERGMASSVSTLFEDMSKRGRSPNSESYELAIAALATENPPKWEKAVELFDKITRDRTHKTTAGTYNALMQVYLNMTPFDWRVVYNCYYELRQRHPEVLLTWESYELVKQAFKKGKAGRIRQLLTFADAWFILTHIRTIEFWFGVAFFVTVVMVFKTVLGYLVAQWGKSYMKRTQSMAESESGILTS